MSPSRVASVSGRENLQIQTALDFIRRFASPDSVPGRSAGTAPASREL
jgi:hypothetical protein